MDIQYRKGFHRQYGKLSKIDKERVDNAFIVFKNNPFDNRLRNHALSGKMLGKRSISAGFNLRLIFKVEGKYITVIMLAVGTHSQVY